MAQNRPYADTSISVEIRIYSNPIIVQYSTSPDFDFGFEFAFVFDFVVVLYHTALQ